MDRANFVKRIMPALAGLVLMFIFIISIPGSEALASPLLLEENDEQLSGFGTGESFKYAFSTLTEDQQGIYRSINEAVSGFVATEGFDTKDYGQDEYFVVVDLGKNCLGSDIDKAFVAFRGDNPLYFFLDGEFERSERSMRLYLSSYYQKAINRRRSEAYIRHVRAKWMEMAAAIRDDDDDTDDDSADAYEIALLLHDLIIGRIDYSYENGQPSDAMWAHSITGVFAADGAVCEGYAKAYQYMLSLAGVRNVYIAGLGNREGHAWNYVMIDGQYYPVDVTWDDYNVGPDSIEKPAGCYDWFCVPASEFAKSHKPFTAPTDYALPTLSEQDGYVYYKRYRSYSSTQINNDNSAAFVSEAAENAPGAYVYYVVPDSASLTATLKKIGISGQYKYYKNYLGLMYIYVDTNKYVSPVQDNWRFDEEDAWEAAGGLGIVQEVIDGGSYTIWAKGTKERSKLALNTSLKASSYKDSKGKTKQGKIVYVLLNGEEELSFDSSAHKVLTKSDKNIASVSGKGVVSAKAPGTVYVYAVDTGSLKFERFTVNVLAAPTKILLTKEAGSTEKDKLLKKASVEPGGLLTVYISGTAGSNKVDSTTTYSVILEGEAKKILTASEVLKDNEGNPYFTLTGASKPLSATKAANAKVTVVNNESGKKVKLSVVFGNPVASVSVTGSGTLEKKGDKAELGVSFVTPFGNGLSTTDGVKAVVSLSTPVVNGKKVSLEKGADIKIKFDKKTGVLTVSAAKDISVGGSVFMTFKDKGTGETRVVRVCSVSDKGVLTVG